MNTELLKSKLLEAAFNGSLTHADTSTWEDFALGEIFLMKAGKNVTAADISEEQNEKCPYPCYGGNGLRGYVKDYNTEGIFPIIGRQGALCGNVKYVEGKFFATEHAVVVRNKKEVDSRWAFHALTFLNLNQYATATAQPGLAVSKIEQVRLSLPPIAEQQRIVAALEEGFAYIDAVASAKQNLSDTAEMLRRKILQAAFEGTLTGADASKWEKGELGKLADILYGFPFQASLFNEREEGHPIIRIRDIKPSKTKTYSPEVCDDKYHIINGDMLVGMDGNFNVCLWAGGDAYLNQRVCKITAREDKLLQKYLYYYLPIYLKELEYWVKSVTVKHLSDKHLKNMPIPLPPLSEQKRIVEKIEKLFAEIDKLK